MLSKEGRGPGIKRIGGLEIWNKASMMRYLRDIAKKNDSHWVKQCHMYMLRGKSLWSCVCPADASRTWMNILKFKCYAVQFIKYKVGQGSVCLA